MQDAQRHRTARANLTAEQRERLRQKNAFQHKMAYISCRHNIHDILGEEERIANNVIQYHNQKCKSLGHCSGECNYREIYKYVSNEEQWRSRAATGECGCRFRWNYSQDYSIIN